MDTPPHLSPLPVQLDFPGLDPRVTAFRCLGFVDSWAVLSDRYIFIIDTLTSPGAMQSVMDALDEDAAGRRQVMVVNTHGDWDHVWGNALFDGPDAKYPAPILGNVNTSARFDRQRSATFLADSQTRHPAWYQGVDFRLPTIEIAGMVALLGGDITLRLIPTPGHTPDHICVWVPEIRTLIAGDAAEMPVPYVGEDTDIAEMRASLNIMAELEPDLVLYSHAGPYCTTEIIHNNIRYLDECERKCWDWRAVDREDVPTSESLAWPLEDVMPEAMSVRELFSVEFYRASHDKAIAGMWSWINRSTVRP